MNKDKIPIREVAMDMDVCPDCGKTEIDVIREWNSITEWGNGIEPNRTGCSECLG